jgi:hypothetical protein
MIVSRCTSIYLGLFTTPHNHISRQDQPPKASFKLLSHILYPVPAGATPRTPRCHVAKPPHQLSLMSSYLTIRHAATYVSLSSLAPLATPANQLFQASRYRFPIARSTGSSSLPVADGRLDSDGVDLVMDDDGQLTDRSDNMQYARTSSIYAPFKPSQPF